MTLGEIRPQRTEYRLETHGLKIFPALRIGPDGLGAQVRKTGGPPPHASWTGDGGKRRLRTTEGTI